MAPRALSMPICRHRPLPVPAPGDNTTMESSSGNSSVASVSATTSTSAGGAVCRSADSTARRSVFRPTVGITTLTVTG